MKQNFYINQNKQVKNNQTNLEYNNRKDILTWGDHDVRQSKDYKKQSVNMLHEEELKRFQSKVKKSSNKSMTTEFQDNFRGYVYVPSEQVYVPAIAQQPLEYLEGPVYIPAPPKETKFPQKEPNQTEVDYNKLKQGTQYRNYYGKLRSENKKELYDVLYDNFVELYPNKVSYNTKIPRKDLYHEENYDEYQQEISQNQLDQQQVNAQEEQQNEEERRLQHLQIQQRVVEEQIQENQRQQQLKEQLQKEKQLVNLKSELQHLLNEQQKLTQEIEVLEKSKGQGFSSYQPIAPPPEDERRLKEREKRIQRFGEGSRQLPNSAFLSYYGKPAFENYGNANVKDKNSGFITGNYLKTHNVNPHRGESKPEYVQTYSNAINIGDEDINPHPPRHRLDEIPTKKQLEYNRKTNPFYPQQNELLNQSNKNQVLSSSSVKKIHPLLRKPQDNSQIVIHKHPEDQQQKSLPSSQQSQKQNQQQQIKESQSSNKSKQSNNNPPIKVEAQKPAMARQEDDNDALTQDRSPLLPEPHPSVESEASQQNLIFESSNFKQSANNFANTQAQQIRSQGKMELLNKKKEKQNLIVTKVTDIPEYDEITFQTRVDHPIDGMNPPKGYLYTMHEYELNPQYYKKINKQWLNKIPYAGKKALVQEDLFEILQHQPYGSDPVY